MNEKSVGPTTGSILRLERMLLECPAFIQRIGGETDLDTQKSIKLFEYEEDPKIIRNARPFAAIWPADEMDFQAFAGGSKNWLRGGGDLVLTLTDNDRNPSDVRGAWFDFAGWVDQIFNDLQDKSGCDGALDITSLRWMQKPVHSPRMEAEQEWHFWTSWLVGWGRE